MIFKFKQFSVNQTKSAMKVGTDATLLASLVAVNEPNNILDIGAGTGVISLMLAQRTSLSYITAVEIDNLAFEECKENFQQSPWNNRLSVYLDDFSLFYKKNKNKYDLIISNPPFFTENVISKNHQRAIARSACTLPFEKLLLGVRQLLSSKGIFSVIIPFSLQDAFVLMAKSFSLFPKEIIHIRGNASSAVKRSIISFEFTQNKEVISKVFTIEITRNNYTEDYRNALKDFLIIF